MVKKVIKNFEIEYLQIKELYGLMVLCRTFDDKGFSMQRQGRIGTFIQFKGQEASQIGSAYALQDSDWMFPMYRSGAALITRKYPIHMLYLYYGGDERGLKTPRSEERL